MCVHAYRMRLHADHTFQTRQLFLTYGHLQVCSCVSVGIDLQAGEDHRLMIGLLMLEVIQAFRHNLLTHTVTNKCTRCPTG